MEILDWVVLIFSIGFIVLYGIWKTSKTKIFKNTSKEVIRVDGGQ